MGGSVVVVGAETGVVVVVTVVSPVVDVVVDTGVVVVTIPSLEPPVGNPRAHAAMPSRRHSRTMRVRHLRRALPFGGHRTRTSGLHATRHLRSGVFASAIEIPITRAIHATTRRPMDILLSTETRAAVGLCRR